MAPSHPYVWTRAPPSAPDTDDFGSDEIAAATKDHVRACLEVITKPDSTVELLHCLQV